ncbi:MAG: hypothetical protein CSB33_00660 [Desulfobacterales bacterium]|nr:MAG: hypothetical protein CSB33_00660 [Desulfobacterales bacterium]
MSNMRTKKCPYCSVSLGIDDTECFSCKKTVGPVNRYGIAQKPFDWMAYLMLILSISGLIFFIWYFFLQPTPNQ